MSDSQPKHPKNSPYARFANDQLTLRDLLAVDRTVAANERTLLGFVRTSLAFFITGVSLVKFFDDEALAVAGWAIGSMTVPTAVIGLWRYWRRRAGLKPLLSRVP